MMFNRQQIAKILALALILSVWPAISGAKKPTCPGHPSCGGETDTTPPGPVENQLYTKVHTEDSMILHWIAPGDDGADDGTVDHYDIRRTNPAPGSACPEFPEIIDWSQEMSLPLGKAPYSAHSWENLQVLNLQPETCYTFQIEAFDEAGNRSGPSYTVGTTDVPIENSPWGIPEVVIAGNDYRHNSSLAFDPVDGRPAFLISDEGAGNTRYAKKSAGGAWVEEIVESSSCKRGAVLAFSPSTDNAAGLIVRCGESSGKGRKRTRNTWAFVERLAADNWVETLLLPPEYSNFSFAHDAANLRVIAIDDGQSVQLVRLDEAPSSPELIYPENSSKVSLAFNPVSTLPAVSFRSPRLSDGNAYGYFAEFDGAGWNLDIVKVEVQGVTELDSFAFVYDPAGEPLFLYRNAPGLKMARRNSTGGWDETLIPRVVPNQMGEVRDLAFRADGTAFVLLVNGEEEIRIGRLCESGRNYSCVTAWTEHDTWVFERVFTGANDSVSLALDSDGLPAVGWGRDENGGLASVFYARCRLGISQVCVPLTPP